MDAEIIGIYGLQGWGKTALTTVFGKIAKDKGYKIYSNYHLKFDYTPITTLAEAQKARDGYMLMDEFWRWVHARTSQSMINKEMMAICLLNRKRRINLIYNSQLPRTIDVILKDVTNMRILPQMITHKDGKRYIHYWGRDLLDRETGEKAIPVPIDVIGKWFNTHEEVGKLETEKTPLEKGIGFEQDFVKAVKKCKGVKHVELIPNSGHGSTWSYDVIVYANNGVYAFDVKGSKTYVYLKEYGKDLLDKIDNAHQHKALSYIAFPNVKYKRLSMPQAWFTYKLTPNCYLKRLKTYPFYNKLVKNSGKLTNMNFLRK